jgi:hypothetical protein
MGSTLLYAFGWEPEVKGIVVVLISVVVLIGGSYLILGTNVGARLGMLVILATLFGWMFTMGAIWWAYGIGIQGTAASWVGRDVIADGNLAGATVEEARNPDILDATVDSRVDGWIVLAEDDAGRGQAIAAAEAILAEQGVFRAGEFLPGSVFDKGGERFPNLTIDAGRFGEWNIDYLAFFHRPHFVLVEVFPVVPQNPEPGRAPPTPVIDQSRPPAYVLMERDLGTRRWPAAFVTIGSGIIFGLLCWTLHTRDRRLLANRAATVEEPGKVPVGV